MNNEADITIICIYFLIVDDASLGCFRAPAATIDELFHDSEYKERIKHMMSKWCRFILISELRQQGNMMRKKSKKHQRQLDQIKKSIDDQKAMMSKAEDQMKRTVASADERVCW